MGNIARSAGIFANRTLKYAPLTIQKIVSVKNQRKNAISMAL